VIFDCSTRIVVIAAPEFFCYCSLCWDFFALALVDSDLMVVRGIFLIVKFK
jgi:hypothetical protein